MITTPTGEVVRDDEGMRLDFVRTFATDIDDLWSALVDPDRMGRWFGTWTGDPTTGRVQLVMTAEDEDAPQTVEVVECDPPTRLVVIAPSPDGPWRLSAELEATGPDATTLTFSHRLAEPYDATDIGPGWHWYLDRLAAVVSGDPVPEDFDAHLAGLAGAYPLPG